jgi:hypothetical protein
MDGWNCRELDYEAIVEAWGAMRGDASLGTAAPPALPDSRAFIPLDRPCETPATCYRPRRRWNYCSMTVQKQKKASMWATWCAVRRGPGVHPEPNAMHACRRASPRHHDAAQCPPSRTPRKSPPDGRQSTPNPLTSACSAAAGALPGHT